MVTVYVIPLRKIVTKLLFSTYFFVLGVKSLVVNPVLKSKKNKLFTHWLYEINAGISDFQKFPPNILKRNQYHHHVQMNLITFKEMTPNNGYQILTSCPLTVPFFSDFVSLKKQFMTINTLIYKCAQVNAQRETDYLSESTYYFRFLNATFIFMCHLVGFIRCGCNIKYYD